MFGLSPGAVIRRVLQPLDAGGSRRPVFVFSGMGPQWWAMGRELLQHDPGVRAEIERVDARFRPLTGWSVVESLLADESTSRIQDTRVAQPALFAIQAGLAALWKRRGVEPAAIVGHSIGEAAALHTAGILTLDDAVSVMYHRSRLEHLAGAGGMLAASISVTQAGGLLREADAAVSIAAINSPTSITLSGDICVLRRLQAKLKVQRLPARMLQVEVPYHSPKMDPLQHELVHSLRALRPARGRVPCYSTVDPDDVEGPLGDATYWWRNVRQTVLFAAAIDKAIDEGHRCFLEIGPHPVLRTAIQQCLDVRGARGAVVASLRRGRSDFETLAAGMTELQAAGTTPWQPEIFHADGGGCDAVSTAAV